MDDPDGVVRPDIDVGVKAGLVNVKVLCGVYIGDRNRHQLELHLHHPRSSFVDGFWLKRWGDAAAGMTRSLQATAAPQVTWIHQGSTRNPCHTER